MPLTHVVERRLLQRRSAVLALVLSLTPLAAGGAAPAAAATSPTVSLSHDGTGARATYTLRFTLGAALPDSGRIRAVFPAGTVVSSFCSASITDNTDPALSGTADACDQGGNANTLSLSPRTDIPAGHDLTVRVTAITNPSTELPSATLQLTTTTETTPVASAPYAVLTRSVTRPTVSLSSSSPSAVSTYTLGFATSPGGSLTSTYGRTITIVAPNGTSFASCTARITDITDPSGSGTASCDTGGNANTAVIRASNDIGASHQLRLEIFGVRNTSVSGSAYTLRVSTTSDRTTIESDPFPIGAGATPPPSSPSSPSPTTSPATGSGACPSAPELALDTDVTLPGIPVTAFVTTAPGATVELLAYSRPSTEYRLVRSGIADGSGEVEFSLTPGTNTRLFARCAGAAEKASPSQVINVETALSLTVVRNGVRAYTFQGRILPRRAGQLISLYRVTGTTRVLTAQLKTDDSGTYRIFRQFTGSGTFGFLTRTGQTLTNAAGESNGGRARPTAVY